MPKLKEHETWEVRKSVWLGRAVYTDSEEMKKLVEETALLVMMMIMMVIVMKDGDTGDDLLFHPFDYICP